MIEWNGAKWQLHQNTTTLLFLLPFSVFFRAIKVGAKQQRRAEVLLHFSQRKKDRRSLLERHNDDARTQKIPTVYFFCTELRRRRRRKRATRKCFSFWQANQHSILPLIGIVNILIRWRNIKISHNYNVRILC